MIFTKNPAKLSSEVHISPRDNSRGYNDVTPIGVFQSVSETMI